MALLSRSLPGLSVRPAFAPRTPVRSCRVRACLQPSKRQQTQQGTHPSADPLQQSRTQLAGAVGLLYPWLMAEAATAATPDGEHLTKWKRTRTIPEELKELRKQQPPKDEQGNRPPSKVDGRIAALEEQRKLMSKKEYKGVHHNWGGLIMGLGTATAVAGPINTYLRAGKLFPGPHLYAGAAIVTLWAGAGAMVPLMAKGNNAARYAHIAMNVTNIGLFAWQVPTGLEIVSKVFQFTSLP